MSLRSFRLVLFAIAALLLTPSVASADWTVSPTANVAGADNLSAVDCSSADSCMAVGDTEDLQGPFGPLISTTVAERWDGESWQIVPTPNPPGATFSSLNGVSCPRPQVCFAVGSSGSTSASAPLIELWNGTSWSIQPSPDVGNGYLSAVSCSGLLACTAVGNENGDTLAERWDGTGWHVQSTPDAPGSESSWLGAVSCPRKRTCTAVVVSNALLLSPLVERWFGRINAWALEAAPTPDGADGANFVGGVSCPDGRVCFAVGESLGPPGPVLERDVATLAERRVGSSWSVMPTPNPTPRPGSRPFATLDGVSCSGRRACHAVGDAFDSTGEIVIAERFDGASWQLESFPNFHLPASMPGVSCPSRLFCMAVGGWRDLLAHELLGGILAAKWTP